MIKRTKEDIAKSVQMFLQLQRKLGYGMSQSDIARETGILQHNLSDYENGKKLPSLPAAVAIADCFDISLDYIVGRSDNSQGHKTAKKMAYKESEEEQ